MSRLSVAGRPVRRWRSCWGAAVFECVSTKSADTRGSSLAGRVSCPTALRRSKTSQGCPTRRASVDFDSARRMPWVDADFPDQSGLVVRRDRFDAWLFGKAASTPNVEARPGTPYRAGPTGLLVGADGVRSMFHRRLPGRFQTPRRVGLSAHVDGIDGLGEHVEVYFHDEGELYVAPTGGGEALVSALFDYRHFRRDGVDYLLRKTPALANRISALQYTTPLLASAPLGLHVPQVVSEGPQGRLMLVGDAAGTPDPISAGGLALALSATRSAADAVVSGDLASYQRRRLGMGRRAARLGQLMLRLSQSERRATFVLRRFSSMVPKLVEAAVRSKTTVPGRLWPATRQS